jgi:hypothetical protein
VDQRHVAHALDTNLGRAEVREGVGFSDAGKKARLVHEGAVWVGGAIVLGQILRVPGHVGFLRGEEIAAVQRLEGLEIVRAAGHGCFLLPLSFEHGYPRPRYWPRERARL